MILTTVPNAKHVLLEESEGVLNVTIVTTSGESATFEYDLVPIAPEDLKALEDCFTSDDEKLLSVDILSDVPRNAFQVFDEDGEELEFALGVGWYYTNHDSAFRVPEDNGPFSYTPSNSEVEEKRVIDGRLYVSRASGKTHWAQLDDGPVYRYSEDFDSEWRPTTWNELESIGEALPGIGPITPVRPLNVPPF